MRALIIEKSVHNLTRLTTCSSDQHGADWVGQLTHFGGHLSITESSERPLRSPLVKMKAESEHFKLAYHKIWICISRYGLDTNKAP